MKLQYILLLILLLPAPDIAARERLPEPNWNRDSALAAAETDYAHETLSDLYRLAREGRGEELMADLRSIDANRDLSAPERDRILHSLALALGDFEPGTVSPAVLEYLAGTRSLTLVAHDERPDMGIPLYNIRAAAAGSLAEWERLSSVAALPDETYASAESFIESLATESAAALTPRVRKARTVFGPSELEAVVLAAPAALRTPAASVVLAELSPGLLRRPAVNDMLLGLLEHRELGGTAALLLGRSGNPETLHRLAELASGRNTLAAKRASLAIDAFLAAERDQ